jgi:molybdenum cofactor synthesis domain-containing protein
MQKKETVPPVYNLLRKTELRIVNIRLENANLTDIARCVAGVLNMAPDDILVVDYRDETLILDVLGNCIQAAGIVGKKDHLKEALGRLQGVAVSPDTEFYSAGMLGWISMDGEQATQALARAQQMAADIMDAVSKRVLVFSSGSEVAERQVRDTNTPSISKCLEENGYRVTPGETLKDDKLLIAAKLREAAEAGGYGAVIITGGVGAEDKDHTIEAVTSLDPEAAAPYICHFKIGTGRHVKDGIRIAVGEYMGTRIVALPGPNDEVRASLDILAEGLNNHIEEGIMAERLALNLRTILREKMKHH